MLRCSWVSAQLAASQDHDDDNEEDDDDDDDDDDKSLKFRYEVNVK
jgi:hypothetical protein